MIDLSQELILALMIDSFITGALIGVLYECVRLVRLIAFTNTRCDGAVRSRLIRLTDAVLTFFTDLFFCLLAASASLLLTYNVSEGVFRGCVYLCMGLGWILYRVTVGKLAYKLEIKLAVLIKKVLKLLFAPLRAIISLIIRIYTLTIGKKLCKIRCRIKEGRRAEKHERETGADELPPPKEEEEHADKKYGYRKEGRRSFCAKQADERRGDLREKS